MAVAVICECNPFHNGHKYLFEQAKKGGESLIAVMSGSFTQRGEAAICGKFSRADSAVKGGADLVLELPAVYAVSCAERFAKAGVRIASAFDCVEYLAFGCEEDNPDLLKTAAFARDDDGVRAILKQRMSEGDYYPRALQAAVNEVYGSKVAAVLSGSNNILALEYIRALSGTDIEPLPVKRVGAEHDADTADGSFASASLIRRMLLNGEDASAYLLEVPGELCRPELLDRAVLAALRRMSADELRALPEVSEGLEQRIKRATAECGSVDEVLESVKTKRYTMARIRRIITCAFLGITEELQSTETAYARVLAMTPNGAALLKTCRTDIITSFAKGMKNDSLRPFLEKDALSTDLSALGYDPVKSSSADYLTKISIQNYAK